MPSLIETLKADHDSLRAVLLEREPSLAISTESTMTKVLLLASASHLEQVLQDVLVNFFTQVTGGSALAVEFVRNKAVSRQYHSYFNWDGDNANSFFGLFGEDFKRETTRLVKEDGELDNQIRAFLELGALRNKLVHQNYASFTLTKTADEIVELYGHATKFLDRLPQLLQAGASLDTAAAQDT